MSNQTTISDIQNLTHSLNRVTQDYLEIFEIHVKGHFDWLEAFSESLYNLDKANLRHTEGLFTSSSSGLHFGISSLKDLNYKFNLANFELCRIDVESKVVAGARRSSPSRVKLECFTLENAKVDSWEGHSEKSFHTVPSLAQDCKISSFEELADGYDPTTRRDTFDIECREAEVMDEMTEVRDRVSVPEERRETDEEKRCCELELEGGKVDLIYRGLGTEGTYYIECPCVFESKRVEEKVGEGRWGGDGRGDRSLKNSVDGNMRKLSTVDMRCDWTGTEVKHENHHWLNELSQDVASSLNTLNERASLNSHSAKSECEDFGPDLDRVNRKNGGEGMLGHSVAKGDVGRISYDGEKNYLCGSIENDMTENSVKSRQIGADVDKFDHRILFPEEMQRSFWEKEKSRGRRTSGSVKPLDKEAARKENWSESNGGYNEAHACGNVTSRVDFDFEGVSALKESHIRSSENIAGDEFLVEKLSILNRKDEVDAEKVGDNGSTVMVKKSLEALMNRENDVLNLRSGWMADSCWLQESKEENPKEAFEEKVGVCDKANTLVRELGGPNNGLSLETVRKAENEENEYNILARDEVAFEGGERKNSGWFNGDEIEINKARRLDSNAMTDRVCSFSGTGEEEREASLEGDKFLYKRALKENIANESLNEEWNVRCSGYTSRLRYFMKHTPNAKAARYGTPESSQKKKHRLFGVKDIFMSREESPETRNVLSKYKKTPRFEGILKMVANPLSFISSGKKTQKNDPKMLSPFSSRKENRTPGLLENFPVEETNVECLIHQQSEIIRKASVCDADQPTHAMEQCIRYSTSQSDLSSLRHRLSSVSVSDRRLSPTDSSHSLHFSPPTSDPPHISPSIANPANPSFSQKNSHHVELKSENRPESSVAAPLESTGSQASTLDCPSQKTDNSKRSNYLKSSPAAWTKKEHLIPLLHRQSSLDPEVVFKDVLKMGDLSTIFEKKPFSRLEPKKQRVPYSNITSLSHKEGYAKREEVKKRK